MELSLHASAKQLSCRKYYHTEFTDIDELIDTFNILTYRCMISLLEFLFINVAFAFERGFGPSTVNALSKHDTYNTAAIKVRLLI